MRFMAEIGQWIHMRDGARLAVTLYLPESAPLWPVVLEANPYRKDDVTASYAGEYRRLRDEGGYAVARVDLRGTGSSEGVAADEYPVQEQDDLCEVVAWLARQSWCTGAVGMYGSSYSGFNSLQVAMRRPPELKAIIAIYATDDRYTDDVHYHGGSRRALDLVDYPLYMVAMNALPPVPLRFGEGWRTVWDERVERLEPWVLRWLEEQVDGPYWRHGSLRPGYERIACPTMLVGGWADGYRNATLRAFERLEVPKRLLLGPWSHASPESSLPGPRIDLVPEMLRWFDRWVKAEPNGVDDEPPVAVYVRRSTRPAFDLDEVEGRWRFESGWPVDRARDVTLPLADALPLLVSDTLPVRGDVGPTASISCAGHLPFGQPDDQRPDDALSLLYEWAVGDEALEILGYPRLDVVARSSAPVAFLSVKLSDVFEDGTSSLVSRGFLNLTHRRSHEVPEALVPEEPYRVTVGLDATSWTFDPGHRIRLALAGADWPNVWPPPEPLTLRIERTGSALTLPGVSGTSSGRSEPHFGPSRTGPSAADRPGREGDHAASARGDADRAEVPVWRVERDLVRHETRVVIAHGSETSLEVGGRCIERYRGCCAVSTSDPGRARAEGSARFELAWPQAQVWSEARLLVRSDRKDWHVALELEAGEVGGSVRSRRWDRTIPRRHG
jgi:predicted acyl esterase